jgi:hypothetical protein
MDTPLPPLAEYTHSFATSSFEPDLPDGFPSGVEVRAAMARLTPDALDVFLTWLFQIRSDVARSHASLASETARHAKCPEGHAEFQGSLECCLLRATAAHFLEKARRTVAALGAPPERTDSPDDPDALPPLLDETDVDCVIRGY